MLNLMWGKMKKRNWLWAINRRLRNYGFQVDRFPKTGLLTELISEIQRVVSHLTPEEKVELAFLFDGVSASLRGGGEMNSQLGQDVWVLGQLRNNASNNSSFTYLEIGAYDPIMWSNVELLRKVLKARGLSVDPNPEVTEKFAQKGLQEDFLEVAVGPFSGQVEFIEEGALSYVKHTPNTKSLATGVRMVTPEELLKSVSNIDYLSLDIEGGELEVLELWPWETHAPKLITVEHNNRESDKDLILNILIKNGYREVLASITEFESWFCRNV